jgi:hypothetical protein
MVGPAASPLRAAGPDGRGSRSDFGAGASRSTFASSRRTTACKSSACSFSAATLSTNQDAKVCGDRAQKRNPAQHQPEAHRPTDTSNRVVVTVTNGGHCCDRPPDRVAEAVDVRVGARPLDIKYGYGGDEGQ